MSTVTTIEWADRTWSPLIGCTRVSPGCDHCYAITQAHIHAKNPHPKVAAANAGLTERRDGRIDWTGRINLLDNRLAEPLSWRKPARVFVNSMSDLFAAEVPDGFIAKVFAVMGLAGQHTFQLLTKRHARMRSLLNSPAFQIKVLDTAHLMVGGEVEGVSVPRATVSAYGERQHAAMHGAAGSALDWPLPNLWLGVSVENQQWANTRIPALLQTPAAVRWISAEPLLGAIDLTLIPWPPRQSNLHLDALNQRFGEPAAWSQRSAAKLDWVVAGGESGTGARPMHPSWPRTLRDQCVAAGVPYLFKQWGSWAVVDDSGPEGWRARRETDSLVRADGYEWPMVEPHGAEDGTEALMRKGSKKTAGRLLDGRTWDEYPAAREPAVA